MSPLPSCLVVNQNVQKCNLDILGGILLFRLERHVAVYNRVFVNSTSDYRIVFRVCMPHDSFRICVDVNINTPLKLGANITVI